MKKTIFAFALMSFFSVSAFAEFSLTCPEMYARTIISKERRDNKNKKLAHDLYGGSIVAMFTGSAPLTLGLLLPATVISIAADIDSKEVRVMDLASEGSRRLERLTKKAKKKINKDISQEEIVAIVEEGLVSGAFCEGFPDLKRPNEVKRYVLNVLEFKYSRK